MKRAVSKKKSKAARGRLRRSTLLALMCGVVAPPLFAGEVMVTASDLVETAPGKLYATGVSVQSINKAVPFVEPTASDATSQLLRRLYAQGNANGFSGILYDNRDRGHSRLKPNRFPQLHHLSYGAQLKEYGLDYALAGSILYPAVVFGNSSTAVTGGANARSLPRLALTSPMGPETSARLYKNNHLYVYPEHRDYDEVDLFPAHWPYHLVSQGSSGSDRLFLRAIAATLAAFPKATMDDMRRNGLVAPTLQMILRRNLETVNRSEDYLDGRAHRPVLRGEDLRSNRMVGHAASFRPEDVPPRVQIAIVDEDPRDEAGLAAYSEKLFDTPSAIARVWRGFMTSKRMLVSAEDTRDPLDRPLKFVWRVLQGDPNKVLIQPQDPERRTAQITVGWHDPFDLSLPSAEGRRAIKTSRVDIGVFAVT